MQAIYPATLSVTLTFVISARMDLMHRISRAMTSMDRSSSSTSLRSASI